MEEYLNLSDVVFSSEVSSEEEVDKKQKKDNLTQDSENLNKSIFLRSFFFQFVIYLN